MIVFYYDKSFEGLLTVLFEIYSQKRFPDLLCEEGSVKPLFAEEEYHVESDKKRAERVWKGVAKKLEKPVMNMLMAVWLSELDEADMLLLRYLKKVFDSPTDISSDFADTDVLRVKQIADKVLKEKSYIMQFTRFQKASDGSFFAPIAPVYNALPLTLPYFTNRFADQKWLLYDTKRRYGFYYDLKKAVEVTMEDDRHLLQGKLDDETVSEDETLYQELWQHYFKSMTIKERINPKLQRQHLPRRFWKYLTEMQGK